MSSTQTFTRPTGTPASLSTLYFTVSMIEAATATCAIVLPEDGVVAREFKANAENEVVDVDAIPADAMMLDVGPKTVEAVKDWISRAATLV